MSTIENVPAQEWSTWIEENQGALLDVREPFEWEGGTLPGAILISMGEIPERLPDLDQQKSWLVVCHSGARSQQVAMYLSMNGFGKVANLAGGMKAVDAADG
jgi:rhodanese-related sulfurtransferase